MNYQDALTYAHAMRLDEFNDAQMRDEYGRWTGAGIKKEYSTKRSKVTVKAPAPHFGQEHLETTKTTLSTDEHQTLHEIALAAKNPLKLSGPDAGAGNLYVFGSRESEARTLHDAGFVHLNVHGEATVREAGLKYLEKHPYKSGR